MDRELVCFIDDSKFERGVFERAFGGAFDLVLAPDCAEADDALRQGYPGRRVDLFVLDLYIPSRERADLSTHPELLGTDIRQRTLTRVLGLLTRIEGVAHRVLDPMTNGDRLLRELYRVVEEAETSLRTFASEIGQTPEGGFVNLRHVRSTYPGVPAVFYTRKANSADVIRCFHEGADGVLKKPQDGDDEDILALTVKTAGDTITLFRECMTRPRPGA